MTKKYAVLFDLDGTLINTLSDITNSVNGVRKLNALEPLDNKYIQDNIGKGAEYLATSCFKELLLTLSVKETLLQFRDFYLNKLTLTGEPYPSVKETLLHLSKLNIRLGICTNKGTVAAEKTLRDYLPEIKFDTIAGPERVSERKPSPKHLLEVLEPWGILPENAYFIGDDEVDIQSAEAAGVPFLAAGYGFGSVKAPSNITLHHLSEILEKIPFLRYQEVLETH
jgi:HAD superfamily hydrolase (TIGR01549 family)